MKQVQVTDAILAQLKAAVGDGVDPTNLAVFGAVAINSLPVRKKHPVYEGGVHPRGFLEQMSAQLARESLPLQLVHDTSGLPVGRVFSGSVVANDAGVDELRVLFWVDKSTDEGVSYVNTINNGTVDQVSVSVLAKHAISNKSGFDFLGPDASFENFYSGTDPDGNVMGQDGAHVIFQGLDQWFEMSLVGRGGIQGARILPNNEIKLAASGQTVPMKTLTLSSSDLENIEMDLTKLVEDLTAAKAENLTNAAKITALEASEAALKAQLEASAAKLAEAETKLSAAPAQADVDTLKTALSDIATAVVARTGDATAKVPEVAAEIVTFAKEQVTKLSALPAPGGRALSADGGTGTTEARRAGGAFRARR